MLSSVVERLVDHREEARVGLVGALKAHHPRPPPRRATRPRRCRAGSRSGGRLRRGWSARLRDAAVLADLIDQLRPEVVEGRRAAVERPRVAQVGERAAPACCRPACRRSPAAASSDGSATTAVFDARWLTPRRSPSASGWKNTGASSPRLRVAGVVQRVDLLHHLEGQRVELGAIRGNQACRASGAGRRACRP